MSTRSEGPGGDEGPREEEEELVVIRNKKAPELRSTPKGLIEHMPEPSSQDNSGFFVKGYTLLPLS